MDRLQLYAVSVSLAYFALLTVPALLRYPLSVGPELIEALLNTAVASTASTLLAVPVAVLLAQGSLSGPGRLTVPLVTATVSVPHTAIGVLLAPLVFGAGIADTLPATLLAMSVVSLPIGFTVVRGALASLGPGYFEFLRGMGLSGLRLVAMASRSVRTALLLALLLSWFRAFSELGALLIVARRPLTVGVYVYEFFLSRGTEPVVGASVALLLLAVAAAFAAERLGRDAGGR